jgi:hypothetical protein
VPHSNDIFATGQLTVQIDHLSAEIPILSVDGIFADPRLTQRIMFFF